MPNKRNENKKRRLSGKAYTSHSGKEIPAKTAPSAILCKCRQQCQILSDTRRAHLFALYYAKSKEGQLCFLSNLIDVIPVQRTRTDSSRRQISTVYRLPDEEGQFITVCKKTFQETFDLKHAIVDTIVNKKKKGSHHVTENRGGTRNQKYSLSDRELIQKFIEKIPKNESHYGRQETGKLYFSSDLSLSKLFTVFKEENPSTTVKRHYFERVFHTDFPNVAFKQPRVDTCSTCDKHTMKINTSSGTDKMEAELALKAHLIEAAAARSQMEIDSLGSTDGDVVCLAIDLQQVIPLPTLTHGEMYYLRQLSCHNLEVHVHKNNSAYMCIWHEVMGSRGASEIASCLFHLVNRESSTFGRRLTIWSDDCAGQNKNNIILFLYMYMIHLGLVDSVEHKFLLSGHSFLSCDRDFALIEKKKKRRVLCDMEDVAQVIRDARKVPFQVVKMEKFWDFKDGAEYFLNTTNLSISSACWLKITKPGQVMLKRSFDNDKFEEFSVWKRGRTEKDLNSFVLRSSSVKVLKEEKKKDLAKIKEYVPPEKRQFFEQLL